MIADVFNEDELTEVLRMSQKASAKDNAKLVRTVLAPHCTPKQIETIVEALCSLPRRTNSHANGLDWRPKFLKEKLDAVIEECGGDPLVIWKVLTMTSGDMVQWYAIYMSAKKIRQNMRALQAYANYKGLSVHDYVDHKRGAIFKAPEGYHLPSMGEGELAKLPEPMRK